MTWPLWLALLARVRALERGGGGIWLRGSGGQAGARVLPAGLWRGGGEAGECCAPPAFAGFGREPGGCALVAVGLADVPGAEDALVADGDQAADPQGERGQARQAAPAAGDAGGGGVLDGGEGPLGAGAPGVGASVLG